MVVDGRPKRVDARRVQLLGRKWCAPPREHGKAGKAASQPSTCNHTHTGIVDRRRLTSKFRSVRAGGDHFVGRIAEVLTRRCADRSGRGRVGADWPSEAKEQLLDAIGVQEIVKREVTEHDEHRIQPVLAGRCLRIFDGTSRTRGTTMSGARRNASTTAGMLCMFDEDVGGGQSPGLSCKGLLRVCGHPHNQKPLGQPQRSLASLAARTHVRRPVAVRSFGELRCSARSRHRAGVAMGVGTFRLVVVPSPSWPMKFPPQQ